MAGLDRESLYAAILTALSGINSPAIQTVSRRFRDLDKVQPNEQPAIFLVTGDETGVYSDRGRPAQWVLEPAIFVYARTDDAATAPSTVLNPILTAIETALQNVPGDQFPAPGSPTTLGGRALHCRIVKTLIGEGAASGQGVAILHLNILAAVA